jgi:hypothetical protein
MILCMLIPIAGCVLTLVLNLAGFIRVVIIRGDLHVFVGTPATIAKMEQSARDK